MIQENKSQVAVFGGGCFWCTEAVFQRLKGVSSVVPGYSGGSLANPSYEQVSAGVTGHAEAVKIEYDPESIAYRDLLGVFFATHDPTTVNRQGADVGEQYRSVIFYANERQKQESEEFIKELEKQKVFPSAIVTQIKPLENFFAAEDYHVNYYNNNPRQPYCQAVINPKVSKLRQKFSSLLAQQE